MQILGGLKINNDSQFGNFSSMCQFPHLLNKNAEILSEILPDFKIQLFSLFLNK
jgi:hypothetical protein